jgi:flavin reductase (DIM6/NTAB) family NADH-FMN oxidoreductase RutF
MLPDFFPAASRRYLDSAVIDSGVALVTSACGDRRNVMTASFFAESSHLPVLLRVAVAPTSFTHELIDASGWFGLSVLAKGQQRLALACGGVSGRDQPKLEQLRLPIRLTEHRLPLLTGCLTTSACRVVARYELPDHTLFLGKITSSFRQTRMADRPPLLVSDVVQYVARRQKPVGDK